MKDEPCDLSTLLSELKEKEVLERVQQGLSDGVDPFDIIEQCHKGMTRVGEYYESGRYFISGLIMAGEIMGQVGQLVFPLLTTKVPAGNAGRIVLGTVEGDIHSVGKDIFKVLVRGYGFMVHDLGIDVPRSNFLSAIYEFKPDIVGLSCLISAAFQGMEGTIAMLRKHVPRELAPKAYIIGGRVDALVCEETDADFWTKDAMDGVRLSQSIMAQQAIPGRPNPS